ncbi:MAG: MinD/ParA family protein [Firmicutes bacterium]|nr:MinD/ParA family protein [Bacillota bacterium]
MNDQATRLRWLAQNLKYRIENEIDGVPKHSRVITVTSGKGGVGKTNIALNLALALQEYGQRVVILDADMGMANVDVITGIIPSYNLYHVVNGEKTLSQIIVEGPKGTKIIPGGSGIKELANLPSWKLETLVNDLHAIEKTVDILMIDTGAGISNNVLNFLIASDEILLVTTPEPTAITDAYGLIKIVRGEVPQKKISLIINKVANEEEGRLVSNKLKMVTKRFLNTEIESLGHVVWDSAVGEAVRRQEPLILSYPRTSASFCIYSIAAKICDQSMPQPTGLQKFFNNVVSLFR